MGAAKKYHFILYISEEQELAIRQLFHINKWELHGKALFKLADVFEAILQDPSKNQNATAALQSAQEDSTGLSSGQEMVATAVGELVKNKSAAYELSQRINEIEKEAEQHATNSMLGKSSGTDIALERPEFASAVDMPQNINESQIVTDTPENSLSLEGVKNISVDSNHTADKDISVNSTPGYVSFNASSKMQSYGMVNNSAEMDPLARASEIAGIPFQQPDGTLHFTPEFNKNENFYQLVTDKLHALTEDSAVQSGLPSHRSGIEQLLRASAVLPSEGLVHYSQVDQTFTNTTSISPSIHAAAENQTWASSDHMNGQNSDSTKLHEENANGHLQKHLHKINEGSASDLLQKSDIGSVECNEENSDATAEVSTCNVILEGEKHHRCEQLVPDSNAPEPNTSEKYQDKSQEMQMASLKIGPQNVNAARILNSGKECFATAHDDSFEVKLNGSVLKIPAVQADSNRKDTLEQHSMDDFSEMETGKSQRKDLNKILEMSKEEINNKFNKNLNHDLQKVIKPEEHKTKESEVKKTNDETTVTTHNLNTRLNHKNENKRKKKMTEINKVVEKKLKYEKHFEVIPTDKDCQVFKKVPNQIKKKDKLQSSSKEENKGVIPTKDTKTYSTRFREKKEMLENVKKKKQKGERNQAKRSNPKVKGKHKNSQKSENTKDINTDLSHANSMVTRKANEGKVDSIKTHFVEKPIVSELYNKKLEPDRIHKENVGKCQEAVADISGDMDDSQTASNEDNNVEIDELIIDIKQENRKKEAKKEALNDHANENVDKIIIPTTKCPDCGKICSKKGYCKTCKILCPVCGKSFTKAPSSMKLYQRHIKKHGGDSKPYPCFECGMKFVSEWFLDRHTKNKHTNKSYAGPFVCEVCQKCFTTRYSLKGHLSHVHGDRKRDVLCDLCGEFFLSQGYLRQHRQYVHQEERNFTCKICFVSVKTEVLLKRHMARHTEEKNEVCNICGRSFRVRSDLLRHMVRHDSNRRSFKCETCGKAFFEDQKLKQHVRIHTGDKPFKCHLCLYACAVKGNLTKHLKTHANREGYLGRAYRRKDKESKVIIEKIEEQNPPIQLQIEVITTEEIPQFETHEQGLVKFETSGHELPQYETCKQDLPLYKIAEHGLLHNDTSQQELSHYETEKQEISHFQTSKQELPHFETVKQDLSVYETTTESLDNEREQFNAVRAEMDPLRVYYETVQPEHIEAGRTEYVPSEHTEAGRTEYVTSEHVETGRTEYVPSEHIVAGRTEYLEQLEAKEYKESADSEHYLHQLNLAMLANNYRNVNVNKIDFYNM